MFSKTVEYALRAMVFLADPSSTEGRTTNDIANRTRVPRSYLTKIIQSLSRAGLVRAQRGVGGGVALARAPQNLTILEVVQAVDPIQRIRSCPLELAAHGVHLCPLHRRLDNALALVEEAFASTSLADILAEPTQSIPLCDFPGLPPQLQSLSVPNSSGPG